MSPTITFAPHQPSPLARTTSPFKDPRPPPCAPRTAKIWDEYEKRAVENARRRETTCSTTRSHQPQSARLSSGTVLDIIKSYDPHSSPRVLCPSPPVGASPHFNFGFSTQHKTSSKTTVAICKTCKQPITCAAGICERCKRTITLPSPGETTPPLSPAARNFASTDLPMLHKSTPSGHTTLTSTSPKRKSRRPSSTQLAIDPPIRLSSLRPPPSKTQDTPRSSTEASRSRKPSPTDPNEPLLHLQIPRKPVPSSRERRPSTPTTPPSTSHSTHAAPRTRPSSLANITTPPTSVRATYPRHHSATPSELSTLYPYLSSTTTSPPSARASSQMQNAKSAWDDSDSEEEEEKAGLVGYWRGRKWRGSRGSLGGQGQGQSGSGSASTRKDSAGKESSEEKGSNGKGMGKRRGFVRAISCGCTED